MFGLIARFLPSLLPAASALLNPWILLALVAASGWLWFQGYTVGASKLEAYRAEQLQRATVINQRRVEVTERVVTKYVTKVVPKTEIVTQTIEKEVIRYAEANPDGICLDPEWRRLHDSAALNLIPAATSGAHDGLRATTEPAEGIRPR